MGYDGERQQGARQNFRCDVFFAGPLRSLQLVVPTRRMEIFNLTLRPPRRSAPRYVHPPARLHLHLASSGASP